MNRAEETVLVWSLADAAKAVLSPEAHVWLCAKIGAGDQVAAINDLLRVLADHEVELQKELLVPVWAWVSGYLGTDSEQRLRTLLARLRVPEPPGAPAPQPNARRVSFDERGRRVRHGLARTASPARTPPIDPEVTAQRLRDNGSRSRASIVTIVSVEVPANQSHSVANTTN